MKLIRSIIIDSSRREVREAQIENQLEEYQRIHVIASILNEARVALGRRRGHRRRPLTPPPPPPPHFHGPRSLAVRTAPERPKY
jgi:hypothetical protein